MSDFWLEATYYGTSGNGVILKTSLHQKPANKQEHMAFVELSVNSPLFQLLREKKRCLLKITDLSDDIRLTEANVAVVEEER